MAVVTGKRKVVGKFSFDRGVSPPHRKSFSESMAIKLIRLRAGQGVVVPMSQHLGAVCEPTVEAKQEVSAGQEVGRSNAFVSAPVHSPVNGVVKEVALRAHPSGRKVLSVAITVGEDQPTDRSWVALPDSFDVGTFAPEAIVDTIRQAGIVGQGGAAFPTAVKLTRNEQKPIDTIILNGCECEPYLTSDHRLMLEAPQPIVAGLRLAMSAAGAERGIIAIEDNKPDAIAAMQNEIEGADGIELAICMTKYPQGGERQLIKAVLRRVVPASGLPLDVGVVVVNVGTASAIAWACAEGQPLTQRVVTVTGRGVRRPGNFLTPVGMMLSDLIEQCGGLADDAQKVLLGGPMMGPTAGHLNLPILKGTSGITVLSRDEVVNVPETACIRCSRCVDYCPVRLVPTRIAHAIKARDLKMAADYDLGACIECGCCAFVCPAKIPLVQYLRAGKEMARIQKQREKAQA